ncbi:flagellar biosynthesis repressor FlbT [Sphingomonas mucosissima]|uniref:Flagellum biosynthesis repressor protein FlbT n=1 Tax=Sphingomonas mucosissima TaxID=370959 RepID=A0A245ZF07_9SPHN|nr:flagellar biosynthesis repressor FlbT [Sphingomonas mucosissima]OWK28336.1 flagellum biosynthesis repressor protein FlbT [Sphingomonas mucosissima]
MSLKITLRDGEKMVINGAVVRSAGRTELHVENHAAILRGREIMSPDEATTPARKLYFACMMAYIQPEQIELHQDQILILLGDLLDAFETAEAKGTCASFARRIATGDFYRALDDCRTLLDYEASVLARGSGLAA